MSSTIPDDIRLKRDLILDPPLCELLHCIMYYVSVSSVCACMRAYMCVCHYTTHVHTHTHAHIHAPHAHVSIMCSI